jgi:hypothetical protein
MRRDRLVPIVRIKSGKLKFGGSIQLPATGIRTRIMHRNVLQVVTFSSICAVVQPRLGNAAGLRFRIRGF